ncbi:hypothetical protein ACFWJT_15805 [Streptomyces sp. NPDC127069]|uniref:DUF7739 domain-containing protein n=1 Tax=Streptomyces sp. NPDC127069 TaxID=3347128 RepID=UPI0036503F7A
MGWYISHGGTKHGYSYSNVSELGERIQRTASRSDWSTLAPLFTPRSGDPFEIKPLEAAAVGAALLAAAKRFKIWDRPWAAMARQIGDSALLAAKFGEPWRWS